MFQAAESLVPIVFLVLLGAALLKTRFISEDVRSGLDRFTYWIALPSLFVHELSSTDFGAMAAGQLVLVLALTVIAGCFLAACVAAILGLSRENFGVFVQAGFRGNLAFVGLPLIIFSLSGAQAADGLVAAALVALAALVPLANTLSVIVLVVSRHCLSFRMVPQLAMRLVKNPLIISAALGGLLGLLGWRLPVFIDRPLQLLGQTALALALISLGGVLVQLELRGRLGLAFAASLLKVVAIPAISYGLCLAFALPADQTFVAMVFAACPTASASFILASQLGGDQALAATCVFMSTILSLGALTGVVLLF
ncbi:MAG: AEC family transporter [Bradymonadaceae bacterium]|nr:AEC family transporter [Lujinxingiaceae bacterium]